MRVIQIESKAVLNFGLAILVWTSIFSCGGKKEEKTAAQDSLQKMVPLESDKVVGLARIEPAGKMIQLFSEVNGIVKNILVAPGQTVAAGTPIIMLSDEVEQSQLGQARAKIATQEAQIEVQAAVIRSLEVKLANAKLTLDRSKKMVEKGAQTQQSLDDARTIFEAQLADIQSAQANLKQTRQRLSELRSDINYYQSLLNRRTVKSPTNGTILSVDILLGNLLTNTTVIGDFAPEGKRLAVAEIDEMFAEKIKPEQTAFIRRQGETEEIARGRVVFVAPYLKKKSLFSDQVGSQEDRRIREIRIELEDGGELLIGSRVEAVISTIK